MKKNIFAFLLYLISFNACAEWVSIFQLKDGNELYIDLDTQSIQRNGSNVKVWGYINSRISDTDDVKSQRFQQEYDCKNIRSRVIWITQFTERNMTGNRLFNDNPMQEWQPIAPNTSEKKISAKVCI